MVNWRRKGVSLQAGLSPEEVHCNSASHRQRLAVERLLQSCRSRIGTWYYLRHIIFWHLYYVGRSHAITMSRGAIRSNRTDSAIQFWEGVGDGVTGVHIFLQHCYRFISTRSSSTCQSCPRPQPSLPKRNLQEVIQMAPLFFPLFVEKKWREKWNRKWIFVRERERERERARERACVYVFA